MTSKIVVNNIQTDAGISSVTLLSHVAGHDSTQNISGINSVTANAFYGSGANLTGIDTSFGSGTSVNSTGIATFSQVETLDGTSFLKNILLVLVQPRLQVEMLVYQQQLEP